MFPGEYEVENVVNEPESKTFSVQAAVEPNVSRGLHDAF